MCEACTSLSCKEQYTSQISLPWVIKEYNFGNVNLETITNKLSNDNGTWPSSNGTYELVQLNYLQGWWQSSDFNMKRISLFATMPRLVLGLNEPPLKWISELHSLGSNVTRSSSYTSILPNSECVVCLHAITYHPSMFYVQRGNFTLTFSYR
jgi:hypothetical protein